LEEVKTKEKNQKYKAVIIFLIPILVIAASTLLYYSGFSPEGKTNNGQLIEPPIDLVALNVEGIKNDFPGKWTIVHFLDDPCKETCWNSLYKTRQVNIRLGRDSQRVNRYLIISDSYNLSTEESSKLSNEYPRLELFKIKGQNIPHKVSKDSYILFDPLGNGILLYSSELPGGELLEDLKKVLQNSKIG
jgi:cytochrome oxidase Cu insertion factor (SCO1/SenC/PrrC family)